MRKTRKTKVARERRTVKVPRSKTYKYTVNLVLTMDNPYNKSYIKNLVQDAFRYHIGADIVKATVRAVDLD